MRRNPLTMFAALAATMALALPDLVQAQCPADWQPGSGIPGVDGPVHAMMHWDADGPGPQDQAVVIAGQFTIAGDVLANNVAVWSGERWTALGSRPTNGIVYSLATLPTGELIIGGQLGSLTRAVYKWTGETWQSLGGGMTNTFGSARVRSLLLMPNGDLIAGGDFTAAGGVEANNIARWDGTTWSPLGVGVNQAVFALAQLPNDELLVDGYFTTAGGIASNKVARWDGSAWHAYGAGVTGDYSTVRTMLVRASGEVLVGGTIGNNSPPGGNAPAILRWDGEDWIPLSTGITTSVWINALKELSDGRIIAGGSFLNIGDIRVNHIAIWDGMGWSALGGGTDTHVRTFLELPSGELLVGGDFFRAGELSTFRLEAIRKPV